MGCLFSTNLLGEFDYFDIPDNDHAWEATISLHYIVDRFFWKVSDNFNDEASNTEYIFFTIEGILAYNSFCDDFGPIDLGSVYEFCHLVDNELKNGSKRPIVMLIPPSKQKITNTVFLIGCYLIMHYNAEPDEIAPRFSALQPHLLSFRDVSPGTQNFDLSLADCWAGLHRAKTLGWVSFDPAPGNFDLAAYRHYADPLVADLHVVVPGKLIAMRTPKDHPPAAEGQPLPAGAGAGGGDGGGMWWDVLDGEGLVCHREVTPAYFACLHLVYT